MATDPTGGAEILKSLSLAWLLIASMVVIARLATRYFIVRSPGTDDYLIVLAIVSSAGLTIADFYQVDAGLNTTHENFSKANEAFWASVWIYNIVNTATKSSIIVAYLRIFPQKRFRLACRCMLVFIVAFGAWGVFGSIFMCYPVHLAWDAAALYGVKGCQNRFANYFTNAALNILIDVTLIIMPMPVLKSLAMPARQKFALMGIFALGGFVCVTSIIRLSILIELATSTTRDGVPVAYWSVIETNVGIICASLPSLRALVVWLWPRILGTSIHHSYTGHSGHSVQINRDTSRRSARLSHYKLDFGKTLGVDGISATHTHVQGAGNKLSSSDEIGLQKVSACFHHGDEEAGIAVTTILEQEIETMYQKYKTSFSEDDSVRGLFNSTEALDKSNKDMV